MVAVGRHLLPSSGEEACQLGEGSRNISAVCEGMTVLILEPQMSWE